MYIFYAHCLNLNRNLVNSVAQKWRRCLMRRMIQPAPLRDILISHPWTSNLNIDSLVSFRNIFA